MRNCIQLVTLLLFIPIFIFSQDPKLDSLSNELKIIANKKGFEADTVRYNILRGMGSILLYNAPDSALNCLKLASHYADRSGRLYKKADALSQAGWCYYSLGNNNEARSYYDQSLQIANELINSNDTTKIKEGRFQVAATLSNYGTLWKNVGNFEKSFNCFFESLKYFDALKNKYGQAVNLGNIGNLYRIQKNYEKALDYFNKALQLYIESKKRNGQALNYANIAIVYDLQKKYKLSEEFYQKAIEINLAIDNKKNLANNYSNLGILYSNLNDLEKALSYYFKALEIQKNIKHLSGETSTLNGIAHVYVKQKNYALAEKYFNESNIKSEQNNDVENLANNYLTISGIKEEQGKIKEALIAFKKHISYKDSLESASNKKAGIQKEMQFNFDKKVLADSLKVVEERKLMDAKLEKEEFARFALFIGLGIVIIFSFFLFNRFKVTQKQKKTIELKEKETQLQKNIIEQKHTEITDSINYAERIQRSFMATSEILEENLGKNNNESNYFVFFKPKDIVSGDFYWASHLPNGQFAFVTADSTGHGVPGAIMSLLNITSLEKAVEHFSDPAEILNNTRKTIIERLKKDGSKDGGKDGMDGSIICFDKASKKLHVAAANVPVYIVKNDEEHTLIEIKPDKMPIGRHEYDQLPFTTHTVEMQKGDMVYTFTDGFPDQFGGDKGKKFKIRVLRDLLKENAHKKLEEQQTIIHTTFNNWKNVQEQTDDVTIIGIRIS